jgi:hypothetical protein
MEHKYLSPWLQEPATGHYSEDDEPSPVSE